MEMSVKAGGKAITGGATPRSTSAHTIPLDA
jgi:hypothetical protein